MWYANLKLVFVTFIEKSTTRVNVATMYNYPASCFLSCSSRRSRVHMNIIQTRAMSIEMLFLQTELPRWQIHRYFLIQVLFIALNNTTDKSRIVFYCHKF